jgi:hypothetical protein
VSAKYIALAVSVEKPQNQRISLAASGPVFRSFSNGTPRTTRKLVSYTGGRMDAERTIVEIEKQCGDAELYNLAATESHNG